MPAHTNHDIHPDPQADDTLSQSWQTVLAQQLRGLSYGTVQLTVHDGRVVQIDCTHRTRLTSPTRNR